VTVDAIAALLAERQQAWVDRDLARMAGCYADDCTVETQIAGTLTGRAALEAAERDLLAKFPDVAIDVEDTTIMGNRAVVTGTLSGTDAGGAFATPGTHVRFPIVVLYALANGRIQSERRIWDFRGFLLERVQDDLKTAAKIQQMLLPQGRFTRPGFEVAAASIPCRAIGGDFFDYFDLPDDGFALTLGDIAGKGPPAALLSASLQAILSVCPRGAGPAATLEQANRAMLRRPVPARFATVVYVSLARDGRLTYSNAGHNPPLLVGASGRRWLGTGGMVLGIFEGATFEEETLVMQPGDRLVAFSDGVTEAVNVDGTEFGEDRLAACVDAHADLPVEALVSRILETVQAFSAGTRQADDLTALALACTPSRKAV
jgi:uncharacterized protein (TIGR02246 family)